MARYGEGNTKSYVASDRSHGMQLDETYSFKSDHHSDDVYSGVENRIVDSVGDRITHIQSVLRVAESLPNEGGGNSGGHTGGGGQGGGGGHGGGGQGGGNGDLYGDQYIVLRDLDPANGGGNGEPVLDENGQMILVGSDGNPVYFIEDPNSPGDYILDPLRESFAQTVELGRANVARSPDSVIAKSLQEALGKMDAATVLTTDAAGRIVCDGTAIDSPLENLALYKYLMTAGGNSNWSEVTALWNQDFKDLLAQGWSPASLLGAAFDKSAPISLDAVLYENSTLGVNSVSQVGGETLIQYFDFNTEEGAEAFQYDRATHYKDVWIQWYEDTNNDPSALELVKSSLMDAVFGGQDFTDSYIKVSADPTAFSTTPATSSGANDFAQAVDDARAVIEFMHDHYGATAIAPPSNSAIISGTDADELLKGTSIDGKGGNDTLQGGNQADHFWGGSGNDQIQPGLGDDTVDGGAGDDTISGGQGDDVLMGSDGKDVISAGSGHNTVSGGNGDDRISGAASGEDRLHGDGGNDTVNGGGDNDVLWGDDGDDFLVGSTGNDTIYGGAGNDFIRGDEGNDELYGGVGIDTFYFGKNSGADIINDFEAGIDVINLKGLGLSSWAKVQAVLTFDGADAHINIGSNHIMISGVTSLSSSDFVL